jgi:hypothetical protein
MLVAHFLDFLLLDLEQAEVTPDLRPDCPALSKIHAR